MATDEKQAFVAAVANQHGERLRRFLASRIRNAGTDIHDLTQEVYLRLLRVPHHQRGEWRRCRGFRGYLQDKINR